MFLKNILYKCTILEVIFVLRINVYQVCSIYVFKKHIFKAN